LRSSGADEPTDRDRRANTGSRPTSTTSKTTEIDANAMRSLSADEVDTVAGGRVIA
jgi:hypothetical protein